MTWARRGLRWAGTLPGAAMGLLALGGCVQVTAPDKPIVIELNVNIRQEVIYRLAADAENTIDQNEDIF
ncbi:YnbE family lipoprotein [Tsuneonella litorea]|nr:YnbE family lipoprotein [Tsuneonella litorea]